MNESESTYYWTKHFVKAYSQLPGSIQKKLDRQLNLLANNFSHPSIRVRTMTDMEGIWEGRVDYRYRFTFDRVNSIIRLRVLGTHEIYQRP